MLFQIHVYTDIEKLHPSLSSQHELRGKTNCLASIEKGKQETQKATRVLRKVFSFYNFLGNVVNENDSGNHFVVFCSAGPKSYGNKTDQVKVECKVQQFSLNVEGRTQLNYKVLKTTSC
ncbi:hypothetical protein P5673_014455 [Acropora cervicornis]|uniref:Uncharacterized protein n=1 Tax=Acropora cervicornis TaxID=6130 RepID=A0AAD9QJZ0_ACRCE|nr:hypothetical protein P5673_014455 [Acropora cervicornis]